MNKIILILLLLIPASVVLAFPKNTTVLDTFDRTNSTTTLGSNWTVSTSTFWGNDAAGISSNTAYINAFTNGSTPFWNPTAFTGTIEAYVTASTLPAGTYGSGLVCQDGINTTGNGYQIVLGLSSNTLVKAYRVTNSTATLILSISQTHTAGDSIGFTKTSGGFFTIYYKPSGGSWGSIGTVTDSTYNCTNIGMTINDTTVRLNDFGGGQAPAGGFFQIL